MVRRLSKFLKVSCFGRAQESTVRRLSKFLKVFIFFLDSGI